METPLWQIKKESFCKWLTAHPFLKQNVMTLDKRSGGGGGDALVE